MKHFFLFLFLLGTAPYVCAQKPGDKPVLPHDSTTGKVTYSGVVQAPDITKDQLHQRAMEWISKNLRTRDGVPPMDNKEDGSIVVQIEHHTAARNFSEILYSTLVLYLKEGKYKYEFTNFNDPSLGPFENDEPAVKIALGNGMLQKSWNMIRNNTATEVKAWIPSLERAMTTKAKAANDF